MNREILFRGKRTDNSEWIEGFYFTTPLTDETTGSKPEDGWSFLCGRPRHVISRDHCVYEVIPSTVGQYTGLCDKNGKRIFEGDIVAVHWIGDEEDVECYEITDIRSLPKMCGSCIDWREVIGNIYDKAVGE